MNFSLKVLGAVLFVLFWHGGSSNRLENLVIQFEDCGSQFELLRLELSTCSSIPCNVEGGNFVTLTAEFDPSSSPYSATSLSFEAYWIIDGVTQAAILMPSYCNDASIESSCRKMKSHGVLEVSSDIFVSNSLPRLNGILHFRSKNLYGDVLMCYKVPIKIY